MTASRNPYRWPRTQIDRRKLLDGGRRGHRARRPRREPDAGRNGPGHRQPPDLDPRRRYRILRRVHRNRRRLRSGGRQCPHRKCHLRRWRPELQRDVPGQHRLRQPSRCHYRLELADRLRSARGAGAARRVDGNLPLLAGRKLASVGAGQLPDRWPRPTGCRWLPVPSRWSTTRNCSRRLGCHPARAEFPKTWDELRQASAAITQWDGDNLVRMGMNATAPGSGVPDLGRHQWRADLRRRELHVPPRLP